MISNKENPGLAGVLVSVHQGKGSSDALLIPPQDTIEAGALYQMNHRTQHIVLIGYGYTQDMGVLTVISEGCIIVIPPQYMITVKPQIMYCVGQSDALRVHAQVFGRSSKREPNFVLPREDNGPTPDCLDLHNQNGDAWERQVPASGCHAGKVGEI